MGETPDIFASLNINLTLVGAGALLLTLILYGIFSLILVYHWRQYAIGRQIIRLTLSTYFVSTGILLAVAALALFFI